MCLNINARDFVNSNQIYPFRLERCISLIASLVGCIDKGVKSKSDIATPQNLLSGPIENTWKKNQRSRFRKTPGTGQKTILTPRGPPK